MMNLTPTNPAFPSQQPMPQQLPPPFAPSPGSGFHLAPQQSPVQSRSFSAFYPTNHIQPIPQPQQPQPQIFHQQPQPPATPQYGPQRFPQQMAYQQYSQPHQMQPSHPQAPTFYNPTQAPIANTGMMQNSMSQMPSQAYNPPPPAQTMNSGVYSMPSIPPSERSPSLTPSQQSHGMAGPPTPASPFAPNNPFPQRASSHNTTHPHQPTPSNTTQPPSTTQSSTSTKSPQSPQSLAQENARVSVLLEINAYLLQEVVSLQAQGKAGGSAVSASQQSSGQDTGSNVSSTPSNNTSAEPSKPGVSKQPSQEYVDCMRRLQANLAYLAAVADTKKKAAGMLPPRPAITAPPPHLPDVRPLYKKLNALFPNMGQANEVKSASTVTHRTENIG